MNRALLSAVVLLLTACPGDDGETAIEVDTSHAAGTDSDADTEGTVDTEGPRDLDRDGFVEGEDCDDREPDVYPGALEGWDGLDNDCDGVIDGRGAFAGDLTLHATAIVEGRTERTSVACDVVFDRATVVVSWTVTCSASASDDLALQLLGQTLTIEPIDNVAVDGRWSGQTSVQSTDGWQADGVGSAVWSDDLTEIVFTVGLTASSLRLDGAAQLARR